VDSEIVKESKMLSRELNREWRKIGEGKKARLFTLDGKSYWQFMKSELNFLFSREMLATLITYYLTLKKIVKSHRVKVVFLVSLGGFYESLLLGVAHKLGKKVVYSAHGYGGRDFPVHVELMKNVSFAAWGNEEREILLKKFGIKRENITITGSPFFDDIAKYRKREAKAKKTVTLLTQSLVEEQYIREKEYFDYVRRVLTQINDVKGVVKIVVKLHPRERHKPQYEAVVKSLGLENVEIVHAPGKDALYSVLNGSDLLVSYGSTTDIEGLMLGKNVIVIDGLKKGPLVEAAKKDKYREAVVTMDKKDDLTAVITKVLTDGSLQKELEQKRREYLTNSFYRTDGKAHERVADLVIKVLGH